MSPKYEQIRTALGLGFSVQNLRTISNLSLAVLQNDSPLHPAVFMAMASVSRWIADAWDSVPIPVSIAERVEGQLKQHLQKLLEVSESDASQVCAALDATATAFREAIRCGLDSDLVSAGPPK